MRQHFYIKIVLILCVQFVVFKANAQETINSYTVKLTDYFPNGDLTVNDTLIIYGNLKLDNDEDLIISSSGVVIVLGDFEAKNKVNLGLGGYFIVTGEFNKNGSQGTIDDDGGSMFIFDDTPNWHIGDPPVDYGDEDDIIDDPIFDFFEDLIEDICDLSITGAVITPDNCDGSPYDGAINITVSGSAGVINYRWRDDEGNIISTGEDISGLEAGDYYITVYQGFCFDSDTFTISSSLGTAGPITGSQQVCMNSTAVYSITPVPGATSYVWTANNGVTGTSTTNSIVLTFPNSGNVTITVYGMNACGRGLSSSLEVTVYSVPVTGPAYRLPNN